VEREINYPQIETFKDGRRPLYELYKTYSRLLAEDWKAEIISSQVEKENVASPITLPIYAFLSPKTTEEPEHALWIIGGVHGEEPVPPNAFAEEIETISALPKIGIPVVAIFVANPLGYHKDWRYQDLKRGFGQGTSVTDCDHLLPQKILKNLPRRLTPINKVSDETTKWALETSKSYIPLLVINHHEDEIEDDLNDPDRDLFYSYAYGKRKILNIICPILTQILSKGGYQVTMTGKTRGHETITDGFVTNSTDGSIDELLASSKYFDGLKVKRKTPAKVVLVPETYYRNEGTQTINQRIKVHGEIIRSYPKLWRIVKENL
jgi:hypothetical protein